MNALRIAAVGIVVAAGGVARAQPRVTVNGSCPSEAQVRAALVADGVVIDGGVTVRVTAIEGGARLRILDGDAVVVDRAVKSADCAAIAETFALIAAGYLESRPEPVEPPPPSVVIQPAAAPGDATPVTTVARPRRSPRLALSVAGGAGWASAGFGQVDVSYGAGVRWRVAVARGAPAVDAAVEREQTTARVEVGRRFDRGGLWLYPSAGGGIAVSQVRAPDTMSGRAVRLHPVATASVVGGVRLSGSWSLRLELGGALFPVTDRYFVGGAEVGESPRAEAGLSVGVEVGFE